MSQRLQLLSEQVKKTPKFVDSSFDFLGMQDFLTQ